MKMPFRSSVPHLLLCSSLDLRKHFVKTEVEGEYGGVQQSQSSRGRGGVTLKTKPKTNTLAYGYLSIAV